MGRTSLVLNIVNHLAQQEEGTILICSSQTWAEEFSMRLFCIGTGLEMVRLFDNKLPYTTVVYPVRLYTNAMLRYYS